MIPVSCSLRKTESLTKHSANQHQADKIKPRPNSNLGPTIFYRLLFILIFSISLNSAFAQEGPQPALDSVSLWIDGVELKAEVASRPDQRQWGLSHRTSMPENSGMLFVYGQEQYLLFTMRKTLIPLSIAFISADMTINQIIDMEPGAKNNYPSKFQSRFALEMNQGWFERNNIKAGAKVTIKP